MYKSRTVCQFVIIDLKFIIYLFIFVYSCRPLFASKGKGDKWQLVEILKVLGTPPKKEWPSETPVLMDQFQVYPSHPWSRHIPTIRAKEEALLSVSIIWRDCLINIAS